MYRVQQEHAWSKSAVEDIEGALERAGLYSRGRPPAVASLNQRIHAITEERGDEAAADRAATMGVVVRRSPWTRGQP